MGKAAVWRPGIAQQILCQIALFVRMRRSLSVLLNLFDKEGQVWSAKARSGRRDTVALYVEMVYFLENH